jgi:polysaccharide biosynthesis protein PelF
VGSCSELINGATREDRELGPSGLVVPFGRPDKLGEAIFQILSDKDLRERMGKAGHERVKTYYQEKASTAKYVGLYNEIFSERFWYGGNRI